MTQPFAIRLSSPAFTAGHSPLTTENITESRTNPSGITMCARNTPSRTPPIRAIAACERTLRASVFNCTRFNPSASNACRSSRYFASVLTAVRHTGRASHV